MAEASRTIYENKVASKLGIEYPSPIFDEMVADKLIQRQDIANGTWTGTQRWVDSPPVTGAKE